MITPIKINNRSLSYIGIKNPTTVDVSLNGVTSEAVRAENGVISNLKRVNNVGKVTLTWDCISIEEAEKLCTTLKINTPNIGENFEMVDLGSTTAEGLPIVYHEITLRLPCGIRTVRMYVGDTIEATLEDYSGDTADNVGGQYWRNFRIALVGLGEFAEVNA